MMGRLLLVMAVAAGLPARAQPYPAPDPRLAWVAGYALIVQRLCPGVTADTGALAAGGLPYPDQPEWQHGAVAAEAFHDGGQRAQAAFDSSPDFCRDPATGAGSDADRVRPVLVGRPTTR